MAFRRLLAASAVLLVASVLGPGQAHAEAPPTAYRWPSVLTCTEVEFGAAEITVASYHVSGRVRPCDGWYNPAARWTIALYRTGGPGHAYAARRYGVDFTFRQVTSPDAWAVCVVNYLQQSPAGPQWVVANRVACLGPAGTGEDSSGIPVPVDDPRFADALLWWNPLDPNPFCGSCL